ncbi:MAG: radical SAM protein [Tissierellia bacterium]|nr:radical SAM protein [Tissierellia bacterium]
MVNRASYMELLADGRLAERIEMANGNIYNCNLCPHRCGIDRRWELGICKAEDRAILSSYGPHLGEEKVLVGTRGSGTIFFGYCNMRCIFCQNYELSFYGRGTPISNQHLAEVMLKLQNYHGCHNINLVTPTHFVPNILEAIHIAAQKGLNLPIVYNCGGYERVETLKLLDGVVDIYMPDFKYNSSERGSRYSQVKDYPRKAKLALMEMDRQVGGLEIDEKGIAYRGLLIRHLMLPDGLEDTKEILDFIGEKLSPGALVNLMDQYYPSHRAHEHRELSRRLRSSEYGEAYRYARELGLRLA